MHSNAVLFASLHNIHFTSNWEKNKNKKDNEKQLTCFFTYLRECMHLLLDFLFLDFGILGGETG